MQQIVFLRFSSDLIEIIEIHHVLVLFNFYCLIIYDHLFKGFIFFEKFHYIVILKLTINKDYLDFGVIDDKFSLLGSIGRINCHRRAFDAHNRIIADCPLRSVP